MALGVDEDAFRDEAPQILSRSLPGTGMVTIKVFREPFGVDLAGVAMAYVVMMVSLVDVSGLMLLSVRWIEVAAHSRGCEWVLGQPSLN